MTCQNCEKCCEYDIMTRKQISVCLLNWCPCHKEEDLEETIICSAVKMSDGYIFLGHRHFHCLHAARMTTRYADEPNPHPDQQGFMTSRNRFVGRKEAQKIHKRTVGKSYDPTGYRGINYSVKTYINMTNEKYLKLLSKAPQDHLSREFLDFLMNNNEVVQVWAGWLIIKNIKYWTEENDWLTAFYIGDKKDKPVWAITQMKWLVADYEDREWLIKAPHKRTVKLFHVHLYKKVV